MNELVGAVDLGGSHVSAARVELATGRVDGLVRTPLRADGTRDELLERIVATTRAGVAGARRIGFAAPGPFDYERGVCLVRGLGKLEALFGVDLRREVAAAVDSVEGADIAFVNDAEAFVLGEAAAGAAHSHPRVIGITLGTGLGSGFLAAGAIVRDGPDVPPGGSLHLVPFRGRPVEDAISARGLSARYTDGSAAPKTLAGLARSGDLPAAQAFADFGTDLGEFLAPWVRTFRPTCVVVGGSIARAWDLFADALRRNTATELLPAARLDDAALVGAAFAASRAYA